MRNSTRCLKVLLVSLSMLLTACGQQLAPWDAGKLVVIVPEATQGAEAQFERDLAQLFAEQLHTKLKIVPLPQAEVTSALYKRKAHLAAASLRSDASATVMRFGPGYQKVRELVVCNRETKPIKTLVDLAGMKLAVLSGSAQEAVLIKAQKDLPSLQWQTRSGLTEHNLLTEVAEGLLDCALANELQLADARNYYPNLVAALDIASPSELAWGFPIDADPKLLEQVQIFFTRIQKDGTLRRLLDRYYGHTDRLDALDSTTFISRISTVLPHYRRFFAEAASLTGEDWRLLAALAYQESQWDPLATSFTNVRGMMMLTEDTADRMKVGNRLDARESIIAGAKYLTLLKEQMPARIAEPDRTWLALAAYNQGYGHLEDARILTSRAKLNPDSWADVKKWMPKLNRPEYYETLKHGYARGGEAVILVENIRSFHSILIRLEPDQPALDESTAPFWLLDPMKSLLH